MAKRRSSRRKQPNTSNGTEEASSGSTVSDAAAAATDEANSVEAAPTPSVSDAGMAGEDLLLRLQAALSELDCKLATADRTLEALAEGIDFPEVLGETLENLQTTVDQLKQQMPAAVRYNTESIVALHAQVAELETASTPSANAGEGTELDGTAIAELRARIQELGTRLAEGNNGELRHAIAECQQRIEIELQDRERIDAEVRSQLSTLEEQLAEIASLPSDILALPETLKALQATVGELEDRQRSVQGTEEIEASVRSIQSATASLEAQFAEAIANRSDEDWQAAASELAKKLEELQQQLPEAVSYNTQSIVSLNEQLAGIEEALKQVSETEGETDGGLLTAVVELTAKFEELQKQLPEAVSYNTQSIVSLNEQLAGIEDAIEQVTATESETDEGLQTSVVELTSKFEELQQQLPEAVSYNTQSIVSLNEQLAGIENAIEQVTETEGETDEGLQAAVVELTAKFEELQKQLPEAVSNNTQLIVSLNEQLGRLEETLKQVTETSSESDREGQAAVSELATRVEELQQQLPEAVSYNTQSIVSLNEQLSGIETALKRVTQAREGDESKVAIAQLEQSVASVNEQLTGIEVAIKQVTEASEEDESQAAIAQLEQSLAGVEEQLQQALAATALVEGLQAAQQELEARLQETADAIDRHPSAEQFSELQSRVESGKRVGSLEALIRHAEALEQKPVQPPTWEVDLDELRKSVELLSRRIPEAYQLNSETTTRLEEKIGQLQDRIAQVADRPEPTVTPEILSELQDAIAALQAAQADLQTQLDAVPEAPVESAGPDTADTEDIRAVVTELTEQLESLSQKLPEAVSYNSQSIVSLQEQLAGWEGRSERNNERGGGASADSTDAAVREPVSESEASSAIAQLEAQLATVKAADERLEMLEISYDDIDKRMDAVDLKVVSRASDEDLQEVRAQLETRAGTQELEDALNQLKDLKQAIDNPVPLWQEDIEEIRDRLDAVVAQLPEVIQFNTETAVQLETQVAQLQQQLADRQAENETATTIARIQEQLNDLQESLETQGNAGEVVGENLRSLGQDVAQLTERIEQVAVVEQDRLDELGSEPWREELQAISTRLEETAATVEQQAASVSELEQRIEQSTEVSDAETGEAKTSGTEIEIVLPETIVQLRTDVDALQPIVEKSSELESQLSTFATTLYALQSIITPLEQQLPEALRYNTQSVVELHEQMEELKAQVLEAESSEALETLQAQYGKLQEQFERVQTELQEGQAAEVTEAVSGLQAESRGLREQVEVLAVRVQQAESLGLENELAALQTECRGLQGQLETVRARGESTAAGATAAESALEEVRTDYRQLQGEYRQLQEGRERDRDELSQLRQTLAELESTVADKFDTSAIAPIQAELTNLLALHEGQNQQAQQLQEGREHDRNELVQLRQILSELESAVAEKSDTSEIATIQAELTNLLALHERQNQQAQQEELREEFALMNSQLIQLEQRLPEAIRLNTQSIVTLQETLQGVESQLDSDDGNQVEELRLELEGLLAQQRSLKIWLISTVGVAFVALAAAVGQVLGWSVGG